MDQIGFIGLGTMGKPMARNLMKAGYSLTIHNRSRGPVDELAAEGATPAQTSAEVASKSDITITMLPDSPDVETVVLWKSGALEGANAGAIIIDMSTMSPQVAKKIAQEAAAKGVSFLDAPVSGGEPGAIAGTLSIMVGGDKEAFERATPVFQAMGKTITYMGPSGSGQVTKLCNQIICIEAILGVAEGLTLAKKAGVNLDALLQALSGGAASSWALNTLGPKMINRDWAPGFKIDLMQKDLRLAEELCEYLYTPLPGSAIARQMVRAVQAEGGGADGHQSVVRAVERLAKIGN